MSGEDGIRTFVNENSGKVFCWKNGAERGKSPSFEVNMWFLKRGNQKRDRHIRLCFVDGIPCW